MRQHIGSKRRLAIVIACGLFCVLVLLRHYFSFALALGDSMCPTLNNGDLLLVSRKAYADAQPRRGEIVIARVDADLVVKRVVGLPERKWKSKVDFLYINDLLFLSITLSRIVFNLISQKESYSLAGLRPWAIIGQYLLYRHSIRSFPRSKSWQSYFFNKHFSLQDKACGLKLMQYLGVDELR